MVIAAVGQLCSTASMSHNLAQCQILVRKAVAAGAKALFLPEASDYIAWSPSETIALAQPVATSFFVRGLQSSAAANRLPINVGIHEPADESISTLTEGAVGGHVGDGIAAPSARVKNTLIWIDERGAITQRYQKLHLFDTDLPSPAPSTSQTGTKTAVSDGHSTNTGPTTLRESRSVEPGTSLLAPFSVPQLQDLRLGLLICFDLRFPTPSTRLRDLGAHALTYPSAFTVATGRAGHWEMLLRARAVENGCYVFAAAQVGRHHYNQHAPTGSSGGESGGRVSYGHSMIVDPWGTILAEAGGLEEWDSATSTEGAESTKFREGERVANYEPEIILAEIHLEEIERIRRGMPLEQMARRDIVDVIDTN